MGSFQTFTLKFPEVSVLTLNFQDYGNFQPKFHKGIIFFGVLAKLLKVPGNTPVESVGFSVEFP